MTSLVINEVLYDAPGADRGWEFVELYNNGDTPHSLEGVVLEWADGSRLDGWKPLWSASGGTVPPLGTYVVGGDSVLVRQAELPRSLQNGPDALRLRQLDRVLDVLGYGDLGDAEYFETEPARDVRNQSLGRAPDGVDRDHNRIDFHELDPTPGRPNVARVDVALRWAEPDWTRLWPGRLLRFPLVVYNRGLIAVGGDTLAVRTSIQQRGMPHSERTLLLEPSIPRLAPADSFVARLSWLGSLGPYRLQASLPFADENPENDTDSLNLRLGPGDVLISEILYAPKPENIEWLELWNRGAEPRDLDGWSLEDASGRRAQLPPGSVLAPFSFSVVAQDAATPIPQLPPEAQRWPLSAWPSLNNSDNDLGFADLLILRNPTGEVEDAFFYSATWGGKSGRSLERLTPEPNVRGLLWAVSKDPGGATPGRENSSQALPQTNARVVLSPNPFSPDGDGRGDRLQIGLEVPAGMTGYKVQVFDLSGKRRRALAADRLGFGPRQIFWDGEDDAGMILPSDVYVLHFEFFGKKGRRLVEKRVVGLVGR